MVLGDINVCWQDEGFLDQIMLRNLFDKAQVVVANACGLEPSSSYWRSQFAGVRKEDHIAKVTSLLQGSSLDVSIIHQLCASQCALLMLLDKWEIRQEGDRLVHKDLLNVQHYTVAIEQQSQSDLRSPRHSSFYKVKQLLQDWASEVLYVNLAMRLTN